MRPDDWERMSWAARAKYVARLEAERRAHEPEPDYLHIPPEITETRDIAQWIYLHLKSDPPDVIADRQELLHNIHYTREHQCSTPDPSAA